MLGTILDVTFPSPTITKSLSSADQPSSRFEMAEMENVSWSRRDLGEKGFFCPGSPLCSPFRGEIFFAQLIRLDGKRRIGLERGWSMEDGIGALSRPSLRQNSSAENPSSRFS